MFPANKKIRALALRLLVVCSMIAGWAPPAAALSGEECLAVCRGGGLSELRSMLEQHDVGQLFRVRDSSGIGLLHLSLRRTEEFWRSLLETGWPVQEEKGWTPQHEAALLGNLPALQLLKSRGARMTVREPVHGGTPLHVAAFNGHLEVVKFLVASGAEVNARDNEGWTPLSQARDQGYPAIVDWLKANGATR